MNVPVEVSDIQKAIDAAAQQAIMDSGIDCELNWVNNEVVLSGNKAALLHVANCIMRLVAKGVKGSHFTIDKADIAPEATVSLTIALREPPS